jgi:uncharacterized membrane protein
MLPFQIGSSMEDRRVGIPRGGVYVNVMDTEGAANLARAAGDVTHQRHVDRNAQIGLGAGLGAGSGALTGAGIGAIIGSIVPGIGTAIGAAIGAALGGGAIAGVGAGIAAATNPRPN